MQYWIDGYNLLFRISHLKGSLEDRRRQLIVELNQIAKSHHLYFVLVFDAKDKSYPLDSTSHFDALEIVYTTSKKTADEAILDKVETAQKPGSICIVSSDRGLTSQAKSLGARVLSLSEFCDFLKNKQRKKRKTCAAVECKESPKEMDRLLKIFEERFRSFEGG